MIPWKSKIDSFDHENPNILEAFNTRGQRAYIFAQLKTMWERSRGHGWSYLSLRRHLYSPVGRNHELFPSAEIKNSCK
jgi:hypothetical protein